MTKIQPEADVKTQIDHRRPMRLLLIITGVILIALLTVSLLAWRQYIVRPELETYYTASFTEGIEDWTVLDARWVEEEQAAKLLRREYAAPYLMIHVSTEQSPPEDFVWHLPVKVTSFSDEALVLGAIILPHGPLAVVVDNNGRLGFARDLFAPPEYSLAPLASLPTDQWTDLYVRVNSREEQVELYLESRQIHTVSLVDPTFPVMEVWLGALWLKGAGNYGAPLDVTYRDITFGNEGLIPQSNFWEFTWYSLKNLLGSITGSR